MATPSKINLSSLFERESRLAGSQPSGIRNSQVQRTSSETRSPGGRKSMIASRRKGSEAKRRSRSRSELKDSHIVDMMHVDSENRKPNTGNKKRKPDLLAGTYPPSRTNSRSQRRSLSRSPHRRALQERMSRSERKTSRLDYPRSRATAQDTPLSPLLANECSSVPTLPSPQATLQRGERIVSCPKEKLATENDQENFINNTEAHGRADPVARTLMSPRNFTSADDNPTMHEFDDQMINRLLVYPNVNKYPSHKLISSFCALAVEVSAAELSEKIAPRGDIESLSLGELSIARKNMFLNNDQYFLQRAGILSFESVILPAIAAFESHALKKWQSLVQRNAPHLKQEVVQVRIMVDECIVMAIRAANASRLNRHRQALEEAAEKELLEEEALLEQIRIAQAACEERKRERERRKAEAKAKRFAEMKRQHPRNKELWNEIAVLMTAETQLAKQERMWKETEKQLLIAKEALAKKRIEVEAYAPSSNSSNEPVEIPTHDLQSEAERMANDAVVSSRRIEDRMGRVLHTVGEVDALREKLYEKYTKDHQFQGYPGVKNPKKLIQFLSQDENWEK